MFAFVAANVVAGGALLLVTGGDSSRGLARSPILFFLAPLLPGVLFLATVIGVDRLMASARRMTQAGKPRTVRP